jgi:hypothetical protein
VPGTPPIVTVGWASVVTDGAKGLAAPERGVAETGPSPKQNIEMVPVRFTG